MSTSESARTRPRRRRRWRMVAIALPLCVAALVGVAHLPFVRAMALARIVTALEADGVRLEADRLSWNLVTLRIDVEGLTLAASGVAPPFLEADAARINLPWSIVFGGLRFDSAVLERPRVTLVRAADGSLNLPNFGPDDDEGGFEGPVLLNRLMVNDLSLSYDDEAAGQHVRVNRVAIDMAATPTAPLTGAIAMAEPATVRVGARSTAVDRLAGALSFDGTTLRVQPLELQAPEGTVRFDGAVGLFGRDPRVNVSYAARIDAGRGAAWTPIAPAPSGTVVLTGSLAGERDGPAIEAILATEGLAWSTLGPVAAEGRFGFADSLVTITAARLGLAGGEVVAGGRIHVGDVDGSDGDDNTASAIDAEWRNLDLSRALSAVPGLRVRPGSISDGTLDVAWTGTDVMGGRATIATTQRPLAARSGVLPIGGPLRLSSQARRWTLTGAPRVAGALDVDIRATGRFTDELTATPIAGHATLAVVDLSVVLRQLAASGLIPNLDENQTVAGMATMAVTIGGSIGAPRATGPVEATGLRWSGTGPATLTAHLDASSRTVDIGGLQIDLGANRLTGQATLGIDANTLTGSVQAELPDLAGVSAALPAAWRPSGSGTLSAVLGGALDDPTVHAEFSTGAVRIAGQTIDASQATLRMADGVAWVDSLVLTQPDGQVSVTGRYAIDERRYAFNADGRNLVMAPLPTGSAPGPAGATTGHAVDDPPGEAPPGTWPIQARFDLQLSGAGTIDDPGLTGQLQFSQLDWGSYQLGGGTADVTVGDGRAQVHADLPAARGTVDAALVLDSRHLTATATLADADLAGLVRPTGPAGPPMEPIAETELAAGEAPGDAVATTTIPVTGTVRLTATAEGPVDDMDRMAVAADLALTDATVNGAPIHLERTARLRHEAGALAVDDLELRVGEAALTARGRLGAGSTGVDGLAVTLAGTLGDFAPILQLAPGMEEVAADGVIDLNLIAFGPVAAPDVTAYVTVTGGSLSRPDLPPVADLAMAATYSAGMMNVSTLRATWQGAELVAAGHLPISIAGDAVPSRYRATLPPALGPARFDVRIAGLGPETLRPFLSPESVGQIAGVVDLSADVEATAFNLDSVTAEVRLDRAEVELARVPLAQTQPTRLRLARRRLDVVAWNWAGTGNEFSVRGHVELGQQAAMLDLGVVGSIDLRMIGAFTPGVVTTGRANLDLTATGPSADPAIEGRAAIQDAMIVVRDPRVAITELNGLAELSRNRITVSGMTANANGGTVSVIGGIDYRDFAVSEGAIAVTARGLAVEAIDGLRTELNTDLTLAMSKGLPTIGGRVTIVRGDYREPLRLTDQLFATLEMQTSGEGAADRALADLQLDIAIVSAQDILVDNNYGRLEVGTNLRVTGTPADPILGGRLAMREGGEIFLGGQTYTLRRGSIDFTNATRIEPNFDIALETRVRSNDITLELTGTPQTLEVSLRGPGISQEDAIALLLTGNTADQSTMAYTDVARGQLLMLLSGELLSTAGRAVGLDSMQISRGLGGAASTFDLLATDSDPDARLTLAKDLSREVEIIVSQSLRETGDITWIAVYRPIRPVELRAATDDDSRETYEFRHELQFGGDPAAAVDDRATRVDPPVSDVRIEGDPVVPTPDLLARLQLEPGDTFDYFTWQRDRDRLAAVYHERGYFEARVSARRRDAGDGTVALVYDVRPGPLTTLRVEGYSLGADITEQIEAAWTESVFDGFLIDDVEVLVRRELVRAHHLRGTVTASIDAAADGSAKQLTVAITPGPRSSTRRVEFTGNDAVSAGDLESLVEAQDDGVGVWMEPEAITRTLEAHYRSMGHLDAVVRVGAPRFENGAAVLPVRVEEGPAYRLGMIGVSGAAFRTADVVREVSALTSGEPYRPAAVEPARRRVEVDYLGAGYNDVSVSTIVGIDRERAIADVVFAIAEGPQQVLRDVVIAGSHVTSAGTINRALVLDEGEPLDMSAVYASQKRLYDTNVFRRVDLEVEPIEDATGVSPGTQPVRLVVGLQELPRFRFRYGVRLSDVPGPAADTREVRPAFVADFLNRNMFGKAISAGIAGQLERDRRLARGILSFPSLPRLPIATSVFVTWSRQTRGNADEGVTPFVTSTQELTFEQRVRPARTMVVTWGYTYSRDRTSLVEANPADPLDERANVARVTSTYAWDRRDDPSDATRGWFHSSGFEYAPGRFGSNQKYVRYLAQQYYFRRLGEHAVLASALRVGVGRGFGQPLPRSERFYAGGGTSLRGFGEESVGGRDEAGLVVGGAGLIQFNQEIRFPIFRWVRGVGFFDLGNVFSRAGEIRVSDLERGAGVGLRIHSPFATIRVDYGLPLTSRDTERARWYFGIGNTF